MVAKSLFHTLILPFFFKKTSLSSDISRAAQPPRNDNTPIQQSRSCDIINICMLIDGFSTHPNVVIIGLGSIIRCAVMSI